jgi:predicted nucleotidyltransferase
MTVQMELDTLRKVLGNWASKYPLIYRVHLFGSRARGSQKVDSDIDIAIELEYNLLPDVDEDEVLAIWTRYADDWEDELKTLLPFNLDLEYYSAKSMLNMNMAIHRSSQLLYEKTLVPTGPTPS